MLEQELPKQEEQEEVQPEEKIVKQVLEERNRSQFEVLPLGWVMVHHNSGMPIYLHRSEENMATYQQYRFIFLII